MNPETTFAQPTAVGSSGDVRPPTIDHSAEPYARALRWHMSELWIACAIVVFDQLTKAAIRATVPLHGSIAVITDMVDLTHVRNPGAAFGILSSVEFPFKTAIIALIATSALVAIGLYAARLSPHERVARFGLALIVGGAAGNLIDRLVSGYVVDFVDVYWRDYHFWAFNVADSAITIGVVVMMIDMIGLRKKDVPKTL